MKKSEVLIKIQEIIDKENESKNIFIEDNLFLCDELLCSLEELGMLPPLQECKLVSDSIRGDFKHSEAKREWDNE